MAELDLVKKYYDIASMGYDERLRIKPFFRLLDALTMDWLRLCLPKRKDAVVLDAGGGTGKWAMPIAELGYRVVIVDISTNMLQVANKKIRERKLEHVIQTKRGDIESLDFPGKFFDFIICEGDVLGLTPHPFKAAKEFSRVLKKGGRASVSFTNYYKILLHKSKGASHIPWDFLSDQCHHEPSLPTIGGIKCRTFKLGEVCRMLEDASMKVVKTAPRIVMTDVLSPVYAERLLIEEDMFDKIFELERNLMLSEDATSMGGHILVLARKL